MKDNETFLKVWMAFAKRTAEWRGELGSVPVLGETVADELETVLNGLAKAAGIDLDISTANDQAHPREALGAASCSLPNDPKTLNAENE